MIFFGILIALIIFSLVILIHEWGHFFAARKFGVKVLEFGLGIPPRAKKLFTDKKGTLFSLNRLPLGGFVRLYGENPGEEEKINKKLEDNKKFSNKNYIQKSIILLAGIFMNFILAIFIFSILFFIGVKPVGINTQIKTNLDLKLIPNYEQSINAGILLKKSGIILYPLENSFALKSGIKSGDILEEIIIQDKVIKINSPEKIKKIIGENISKEIIFKIKRIKNNNLDLNKSKIKKEIYEEKNIKINIPNNGKIGSYLSENVEINKNFKYKYSLLNSIKFGTLETYNQVLFTFKGIGILGQKIFNPKKPEERKEALNQMSGPIGIVDFISSSFSAGLIFLAFLTAIISINLGVFNLLPIPALDGGRWLLLTINTLVKKLSKNKISIQNFENFLHIIFFIILIALSILIGYNDIDKIINR